MSKLPWLSDTTLDFPPVCEALPDPDGLLAVGGDLSAERLVKAYENGIFPWYHARSSLHTGHRALCDDPRSLSRHVDHATNAGGLL